MKKCLIAVCLLLVAVSAVRAQAQLVSGPTTITGRIGSANLPLGTQLYDNAGTPKLAADLGARQLFASDGTTVAMEFDDVYPATYFYGGAASGGLTIAANDTMAYGNCKLYPNGAAEFPQGVLDALTGTSVFFATRQLIANDGSTVALDWSDPATLNFLGGYGAGGVTVNRGDFSFFDTAISGKGFFDADNSGFSSTDGNTTFNNSGFHGIGSVIAGTKTATGTATTTFTVTIGVTMANTTYKVTTEGDNALSAAVHYVNNKTTTSFDIVYLAGLTGSVAIDWIVSP